MAIYRTGTASMNANGVITGVGTKWQDKLSLIRVGATMVFMTQPLALCTISAIVSDTELRATQTDGKVVPAGTNYVILLHDSITVDGLAQDVAETLRYYQSKETVIEDAIEFFQNFDFDKYKATADQVKADAIAAAASQVAANTSETNAKTSETNAKSSETAAAASRTAAAASQTAAKTSETNAKTSENNANSSKNAAAASQAAAKTSETNAKTSETNANSSKVAAAASQTAAKTSETNAKTSETNAASSRTAAAGSATAAAGSATAAAGSASAAAGSATTSKNEADRAKTEADRAATANPDNQLKKANNLSDVANMETARTNIRVNKLVQGADRTLINSQNGSYALMVHNTGLWGAYSEINSQYIALGIAQGGTGALNASDARTNFGLGVNDSPEFSALYARAGIEVRTMSDNTNPAGSLVSRRGRANGTTIVSSEMRANYNGSVEWIKRDESGTPRSVSITEDNYVTFNGLQPAPSSMELGIKNGAGSTYVDFHYDGTKNYDYSARIICDGMNSEQSGGGNLRVYAGFTQLSSRTQTNVTGGRFLVNSTDALFDTQVGLAAGSIQVPRNASDTTPIGAGLRGIHAGVDSNNFNQASNINFYSWYGVGFCTAYTSPTNGIVQGKPAVLINTRDGNINTMGLVISKGVTLTSDFNKKADVVELDGEYVSDLLDKVSTYSYRYKEGSRYTAGVIAQELQIWMPQLVSANDCDGSLQVDYMGLMGYMHAAFKHEKAKRKEAEARLKKLESYLAFKFPEDFAE